MLVYGDKRFKGIGITNGIGLDTSDADITPVDMQNGRIAYANGEKVVGTGKCFEFARYGKKFFDVIFDEQGNEVYGCIFEDFNVANVLFFSTAVGNDILSQEKYVIRETTQNKAFKVGTNQTTGGNIYVVFLGNDLIIYSTHTENTETKI